jgi:hypothetical protein
MTDVARYIASSFEHSSHPAAVAAVPVTEQACTDCNYSNNYYGDQVCQPKSR